MYDFVGINQATMYNYKALIQKMKIDGIQALLIMWSTNQSALPGVERKGPET